MLRMYRIRMSTTSSRIHNCFIRVAGSQLLRLKTLICKRWSFCVVCTSLFTVLFLLGNAYHAYMLSVVQSSFSEPSKLPDCKAVCGLNERGHADLSASNVPFLTNELLRISNSVRNELLELEQRRHQLISAITTLQSRVEYLRSSISEHTKQFLRLKATINSYESHVNDLRELSVFPLNRLPPIHLDSDYSPSLSSQTITHVSCSMDTCVNWEYCSLSNYLRFCLVEHKSDAHSTTGSSLLTFLRHSPNYIISCPTKPASGTACVQIVVSLKGALECLKRSQTTSQPTCVALLPDFSLSEDFYHRLEKQHSQGRLILASSHFPSHRFRPGYDFLLFGSHEFFDSSQPETPGYPSLIPGRRPILLACSLGLGMAANRSSLHAFLDTITQFSNRTRFPHFDQGSFETHFYQTTTELLACWPGQFRQKFSDYMILNTEWFPCQDSGALLRKSTFGLLLTRYPASPAPSLGWQTQLVACLAAGAIPVIVDDPVVFPLIEAIPMEQWSRVVIRVPKGRIRELPIILSAIPENHLIELRRQGQLLYRRHMETLHLRLSTFLLALSRRFGYPQPPAPDWDPRPAVLGPDFQPNEAYIVSTPTPPYDTDDFLGPIGPEQASPRFTANYTGLGGSAQYALVSSSGDQAHVVDPFWSHPSTPWDPFLPSDAAFSDDAHTHRNLRPINHTLNLAGYEFHMNLGGMYPYEQFTVVVLTYNRLNVLYKILEQLLNLPYLHSVLVVWNHPQPPLSEYQWPQLHVPIKVVHSENNSLNNRFLPYSLIKTDCVFSIDDDIQLRQDELIFGFRVWRENRDRIVGFPTRAHFWNATNRQWYYNSDYTCEFSMILSGAAFLHKYYLYAYTYEMPMSIRQMVDEQMNCEDLAMNFLVAHLTRKAPIKVTVHWVIHCAWCGPSLHQERGHYTARSTCLNWLTKHYGYNPLIYTQYRADSVLFKTRLPNTKQKCYKYV